MLSRDTTRITQAGPSCTDPLYPQLVLPRRRVIVHGEPLARPEPEVGEANLGAVLGIVLPAENAEAVEVEVLPPHRRLDGGMQVSQRRSHCDFDPSPDSRLDAE